MAPKKKGQKMDLGAFLSDTTTGNWADEMDSMPSAPGDFEDILAYKRGGGSTMNDSSRYGDRESRPPRPDVPFPTAPPYTAFVGNLSFETGEEEIRDMFVAENLTISSVRIVKDHDGKLKGFCYVEFPEAEMLRHALNLTNTPLGGRNIRISVAEAPRAGESGRSAGDWTRSGPLPDLPGRGGSSRPGGFGDRERQSSGPVVDSGRDWGDVRGGKFAPAPPAPSSGMGSRGPSFGGGGGGGFGGGFRERQMSGGAGERGPPPVQEERDWSATRGAKFQPAQEAPSRGMGGMGDRRPSGFGAGEENRDWRGPRAAPLSPSGGSESPSAPPQRRKLELSARSTSGTPPSATEVASPSSSSSKPNPFGGAAPVNTFEREKEIEARAAKEKAEAAEKAAAKRTADAEAAASAKKGASNPFGAAQPVDSSEREKEVERKIAQEKENLAKRMAEAKLAPAGSTESADAGEGQKAAVAPKDGGKSWRTPAAASASPSFGRTQSSSSADSQKRPANGRATSSASSSNAAAEPAPAAVKEQKTFSKNQGIRKQGFSFANIAGGSPAASPSAEEPPSTK